MSACPPQAPVPSPAASIPGLVPGLRNAYWFATFNALSFHIVLGSPMVLYARHLDASATVLGLIAGMMPLLVVFQIPAARHISRVGFKRFVFAGWGTRVLFIFLMALVPLTASFLSPPNQIALLLFLLFGFNLSRGISSAAWLPWITAIVPAEVRGKYLARDSACVNSAGALTLLLSGLVLGTRPGAAQFSVIFAFSALTGAASLLFLKRIPDAAPPAGENANPMPVPWREIALYPPFRKLLGMNIAWSIAYGGLTAFTVAYLKTVEGMTENRILFLTAASYLGGIGALLLFGAHIDRHGSKPILLVCLAGWIVLLLGWLALSSGLAWVQLASVLGLEVGMGLGYAVFSMANTRLAMAIVPTLGCNHFFALFSVVGSLTLGLAPIGWGLLIDLFGPRQLAWGAFALNRFSLFFLLVTVAFVATLFLCRQLHEPRAANVEALLRDLLLRSPVRSWMRFWPRG